jgi:hypothetical protein
MNDEENIVFVVIKEYETSLSSNKLSIEKYISCMQIKMR